MLLLLAAALLHTAHGELLCYNGLGIVEPTSNPLYPTSLGKTTCRTTRTATAAPSPATASPSTSRRVNGSATECNFYSAQCQV
jgi:hypothetical protein